MQRSLALCNPFSYTRYPGSNLHPLKGEWAGFWAVNVSGNRRMIFRFEEGNTYQVNYLDSH